MRDFAIILVLRIVLPKSSSFGLGLSARAVFRHAASAVGYLTGLALMIRCFAVFTAASAWLLDWGDTVKMSRD